MSFYETLAAWAAGMERRRVEAKARKKTGPTKKLTYANFANTMSSFEGSMSTLFELSGNITLQRLGEMVAHYVDDMGTAISDVFDQKLETMQRWIENGFKLYENSMQGFFTAYNTAAEQRYEAIRASTRGLYLHMEASEKNQSERYLAIHEHMRQISVDNNNMNAVNFKTMIALFENLTEQIQKLQKRQVVRPPGPTLPWLMEKAEDLIWLGTALKALQENTAPASVARLEVVKSIRSLSDQCFSINDVAEALEDRVSLWNAA